MRESEGSLGLEKMCLPFMASRGVAYPGPHAPHFADWRKKSCSFYYQIIFKHLSKKTSALH